MIQRLTVLYLICTVFCKSVPAQSVYYDLQKDRVWVDSLKRIIRKGFEEDASKRNNYLQELKYFNACISLGQYYEALFKRKVIPTNRQAVYYYEKVTDFGRFPDDPKYFKALALRNNLCRKLAAIYFNGTGVKKNREKSLELALKGSMGYSGFYESYSKKYFHTKGIMLRDNVKPNYDTDTVFSFVVNPFALQGGLFAVRLLDDRLEKIAAVFKERQKSDSSLIIYVVNYPEASARTMSRCGRIVDNIKTYFVEKTALNANSIFTNCEINDGASNILYIRFSKEPIN